MSLEAHAGALMVEGWRPLGGDYWVGFGAAAFHEPLLTLLGPSFSILPAQEPHGSFLGSKRIL